MIGYLNYIQDAPTLIISMSAICGALYGYLHRWSWSDCDMTLTKYLFGDMKMFFRVASVLAASIAANVIVDIPAELSGNLTALITLGFGIGLAVPQKIEEQQKKLEEKDKKKDLKNLQENNNANA